MIIHVVTVQCIHGNQYLHTSLDYTELRGTPVLQASPKSKPIYTHFNTSILLYVTKGVARSSMAYTTQHVHRQPQDNEPPHTAKLPPINH